MAGHSKWAQIKHKKAVTDARRGRLWTRIVKEVTVAARLGGGDPDGNARLRNAVQEAKAANIPSDNIERAIKRGTGELAGYTLEEIVYEGYAPGGVAVLVETMTDNRNRTVSEIRHLFAKHGGNFGETGCVGWMFTSRGYFAIERAAMEEERFVELALEIGAEDVAIEEDAYELYTTPEAYSVILDELRQRQIPLAAHELGMFPHSYVEVDGKKARQVMKLMDALEEHDDVQHVWANLDVDPNTLADDAR